MGESYPRRLGKYVLVAPLAQGGMGELHLAFTGSMDLKKVCVIKTILSHLADDEFITRFLDEAKVMVKLSHGNLVPVLEAGQADSQYFLAMEYIDGKDLRAVWTRAVEKWGGLPTEVALYLVKEVCRGLSYVHSYSNLNLVHRDVSPPNVLLSYTGEVRLTDFGVAQSSMKLQKTAPGILLGKLSYMSPEQAKGETVDARADLYSVGVILWELLTGMRLFPAEGSQVDRYRRAIEPVVVPPSSVRRDLLPALDLLVLRATARNPRDRHPDAETLRQELARVLAEVAPAIDGAAVQNVLFDLYGDTIERAREERHAQMDTMACAAVNMLSESRQGTALTRPITPRSTSLPPPIPGHEDLPELEVIVGADDLDAMPQMAEGTLLAERYRIEGLVGEGGMGRVYLATHEGIGKRVAVKVLHASYSRMPDLVSRFRREARAASRVGNPHIVQVFDSGTTDDGCIYFVMEHLNGIDLADVLGNEGTLEIGRVIEIGIQICEAVAAAHDAGIVHRDLKPENIYLTMGEGTPDFVKVLDFGLARASGLEESRSERLTSPGMAMGTPEYMAPEQAAGGAIDHRADIYAVGAILYETLVGQPPHTGENILEVFNRKATQRIVPPLEKRPEVSSGLDRLVMWALADKPEDRPQTCAQLAYELTKLSRGRAGAVASLLGLQDTATTNRATAITGQHGVVDPSDNAFREEGFTAVLPQLPELPARRGRWMVTVALGVGLAAALGGVGLVLWTGGGSSRGNVQAAANQPAVSTAGRNRSHAPAEPTQAQVNPEDARASAQDAGSQATTDEDDSDGGSAHEGVRESAASTAEPPAGIAKAAVSDGDSARDQAHRGNRRRRGGSAKEVKNAALGWSYLRAGRFAAAREVFEVALTKRGERGQALLGLAKVDFELGHYDTARKHAEEALARDGDWRAQLALGNIYYKLRDYKKAVKMYELVLAQKHSHLEAKRNLEAARKRLQ